MKIVTWNCNMAFRKKAHLLLALKPDILVIQECEHPDKLIFPDAVPKPKDQLWFGRNLNKGMGIFSYGRFRFREGAHHEEAYRMIVPIAVTGGKLDFTLYAVWANNPSDPDGPYVTQVWKALHRYIDVLRGERTILIGDFNSNTIWDRPRRAGNHSAVVAHLEERGIHSAYHKHFGQAQGKELQPTLYMYRHKDKPYHIDFCFASDDMLAHLKRVEVGDPDEWLHYSDHVPVIVTFKKTLNGISGETGKGVPYADQ